MENYAAVKARMFAKQRKGDTALCGVDDGWSASIADKARKTGADVRKVSVVEGSARRHHRLRRQPCATAAAALRK
jgi:UDP-N-acetylmuramoylalanine-D-glutamate ligase